MPAPDDRMLSVSEITNSIRTMLGDAFPGVWVKGEISGFRGTNNSGHAYFNVKDANATLNVVIFKGSYAKLNFVPRDGMEVEVFGNVDVYPPSGKYQLIVKQIRPAGIGALLLQFEELKRRLAAEGLFATERKQDLPRYPRTIGAVTSPIGAAVRDILKVLRGRWPGVRIVLAPVKVQGEGAADEIAAAIERFDRWGQADVLIVGRGGGSIEDLWAFNEEPVVRAIAAARTPIISAVGHEVDTTLADHAADRRAATPSNAAEIAVRDSSAVRREVVDAVRSMGLLLRHRVQKLRATLQSLLKQHGFRRVKDVFNTFRQRTDDLGQRLDEAVRDRLAHR
ncbi:MAG: exodeoxyribonuclease VII large subunit, partial [bacterium]